MSNKYDFYDLEKVEELAGRPETIEIDGYYWDPTDLPPKDYLDTQVPASFKNIGKWMRSKMNGLQTRETMARLAEMVGINTHRAVDVAERTQIRQDAVEDFNNQVIQEMTDKDVISAPELIATRKGYINLEKRLDDEMPVNPKWFGAVGDGITDDSSAIKAAHIFANEHGHPVSYPDGKYLMREDFEIPVKTDVYAEQAEILIDLSVSPTKTLYQVLPSNPSYTFTGNLDGVTIKEGDTSFPTFANLGDVMVRIEDQTKMMYIRAGANADSGVPKFDNLIIRNNGELVNEVVMDFDLITRATVYPIDEKILNVTFGKVTTLNNAEGLVYTNKGIVITRSRTNLTVMDESITPFTNDKAPNNGVIRVFDCAYVTIKNSVLQTKPRIDSENGAIGSYSLNVARVCYLTLDGVRSAEGPVGFSAWGVMGGNSLKDFLVKNSVLNRIDSHRGSHNIAIQDSVVGLYGITVTGTGHLDIQRNTFINQTGIILREDYGGSWRGKITIKDIVHRPVSDGRMVLLQSTLTDNHDFGYECHLGTEINIENYEIDDTKDWNVTDGNLRYKHVFYFLGSNNSTINPYYFPSKITLKNIKRRTGDKFITIFSGPDYAKFRLKQKGGYERVGGINQIVPNVEIIYDNVDSTNHSITSALFGAYSEGYVFSEYAPFIHFIFRQTNDIVINMGATPIKLDIYNSVVKNLHLIAGQEGRSVVNIHNSALETQRMWETLSVHIGTHYPSTNIFNTLFKTPKDINGTLLTSSPDLLNAHRFLGFMRQDAKVAMRANVIGCFFSPDYPLDTLYPNWRESGIDFTTFVNQQYYPLG